MSTTLPENFTARPATMDDVEAAVELVNACSAEQIGRPEWRADQFRRDWQSPNLDPQADLHLAHAPDGTLVGYAGVWDSEPHVRIYGWGNVHPECRGRGIGTYLAEWVEGRARQSIPRAPSGARVALVQQWLSIDAAAQELLLGQGYQVVRHAFRMVIEMSEPPPEPVVPEGLTIRSFVPKREGRALIRAVRDSFQDHWGYVEHPFEEEYQEWVHWMEGNPDYDPSLWFVGVDEAAGEIAGMSLCSPKTVEDPRMGWVDTLGVRRRWRRQGLALALLHHTFGQFYRRGTRKVGLGVDAQSLTGATHLYEKAGMHVDRQFVVYEKELRPGEELSTQVANDK
jgi:mycothiol synthase